MKTLLTIAVACLVVTLGAQFGQAQITIPTNSYLPAVGTTEEVGVADTVLAADYDAVAGGSGHMDFDFSSLVFSTRSVSLFVDPATAPHIDSFPGANLVSLMVGEGGADSSWSFGQSLSLSYEDLGSVLRLSGFGETIQTWDFSTPDFVFPLAYGNTWTAIKQSSSSMVPGFVTEMYDTTFNHVDAWGSAIYGSQSVPCLRISYVERTTTVTTVSGFPASTTVDTTEGAIFIGAGTQLLANVEKSVGGGMEYYFASAWSSFVGTPTDVRSRDDQLPNGFTLNQNYPNPFNPTTEIEFSLPHSSPVRLEIYNVLGQMTRLLLDQQMPAGTYTAEWDGTDDSGSRVASGIYFYRLSTDSFSAAKKMLLLK